MKYVILTSLVLASLPAYACSGLEASGAWVREAPPGAAVLAGFGELRNAGPQSLTITGVRGAQFKHVMLHQTVFTHGEARMESRDTLLIAPKASRVLAPNGLHLMLMHPHTALRAGQRVTIEFECEDAHTPLSFPVRRTAP